MLKVGSIVYSASGRDKDRFYAVVDLRGGAVLIADGKVHKLDRPKRKNPKHLRGTAQSMELDGVTDKKLRAALAPLNEKITRTIREEGGNELV